MIAWLRWQLVRLGYWFRPYDMLLDARRWRWEPNGHQRQAKLLAHLRRELEEAGLIVGDVIDWEDPK